ncbi:hypothetical protein BDZ91DRAFT_796760 [Kalaharituber pfeilii]|nr:hypothetical protein BDZ91DRAFT_796760 [Kalaharituber pfeilii]
MATAPHGKSDLQKLLELVADPFRDQFNQNSIVASVGSSLITTAIIFIAWCLIRPYNTIVYAPKLRTSDDKHAPPRMEPGLFAWWKPLWQTKEADLVDKIGVDATLFLRVLRMCRTITGVLGLLGVVIVIPVNVSLSKKVYWVGAPRDPLTMMSPKIVFGPGIWSQVVLAWLFDAIIMYFLWVNYKAVFQLRQKYFESQEYQQTLASRTLMVTDIPSEYRSDQGLERILHEIKVPSNADENCVIGRAVKDLPGLIEQHNEAVYELEEVLAKYLKNPDRLPPSRPTCKPKRGDKSLPKDVEVDAIMYLYSRIDDLEKKIYHIRDTVDSRDAEQYGFISYPTISQAHIAAKAAKNAHIKGTTIQLAPKPQDLIWENLGRSKSQRRWNAFMGNVFFTLLSIGFVAPNAFIAVFLSDISRIAEFWPAFRHNFYGHPKEWAFVQGFITPVITSIIYLLLPIVMRRLSKWQGDLKKTARERHVTTKLYTFFVFNNLIIFSLFSTLWEIIVTIIEEAQKKGTEKPDIWNAILKYSVATKITIAIFRVAPFWMMYLLQRNMGAVLDLAQIFSLLWGSFSRKFLCPTPRQIIMNTAPPTFDYATYYNYFLFYFTIALAFATLQPLMLVIAFLYFMVDSWLKKYLLMYVFVTKIESGGAFWRLLFNRFLFAAGFANVIVGIVVWVQYDVSFAWAWVVPLPIILILFKLYCRRKFDEKMYFHTKTTDRDSIIAGAGIPKLAKRRNEKLRTRFGHPALYRPLIHPMVRKEAQKVLAEVYHGRTNTDNDSTRRTLYGEIDLDVMERGRPGKKLGLDGGTAGVDFVEEAEMDFAVWKHKPGFSEEHGDAYSLRGSVYGTEGWTTPGGLRTPGGLPGEVGGSPRSSLDGGVGLKKLTGQHHNFGSRPASPLSTVFTPTEMGGFGRGQQEYRGIPSGPGAPSPSPLSGSRPQSPGSGPGSSLPLHHHHYPSQPISRAHSPLHTTPIYPPSNNSHLHGGGGMLSTIDMNLNDTHSIHSSSGFSGHHGVIGGTFGGSSGDGTL